MRMAPDLFPRCAPIWCFHDVVGAGSLAGLGSIRQNSRSRWNMNGMNFGIRLLTALLFGAVIGLERQWRQRMTGLRTNGLVAVGSAMFIMMGGLIAGEGSQGGGSRHTWSLES